MPSAIPEKLLVIADEIDAHGHANLTRLTVLKKWFELPGRLPAFGLWIARRAAGRKGRTKTGAGALLNEARALLGSTITRENFLQTIDRRVAKSLHDRARNFQTEFEPHSWGPCGSSLAGHCSWSNKDWRSIFARRTRQRMATNWRPISASITTPSTATACAVPAGLSSWKSSVSCSPAKPTKKMRTVESRSRDQAMNSTEKRRIVAKVDELMAALDTLAATLTNARATAKKLLTVTIARLHAV
jgi:hypothetical protein